METMCLDNSFEKSVLEHIREMEEWLESRKQVCHD